MSWWQSGVIYHVYPRSFADADGDGVGDLRGLAGRLDHLRRLGVDAVWLSPIYRSPMKDFGYDISDHTAIDPLFGTLDDFDALVAAAHRARAARAARLRPQPHLRRAPVVRGVARTGTSGATRRRGRPPTTGSACSAARRGRSTPRAGSSTPTPTCASSPTSNWRNPELREAMLGVLRFWLDRGVDGFRVDALRQVLKDPDWRDNPPNPDFRPGLPEYDSLLPVRSADHDDLAPVAAIAEAIAERDGVMIGELYLPFERLVRYYGAGVHLPSNMHLISAPWEPRALADLVERYEAALPPGAWPNWVLGNHDRQPRRDPARARAGARGRDAAADAARDADALLRRRARDDRRRRSRPIACRTRTSATRPGSASAATRRARRCSGATRPAPASPTGSRGCRWATPPTNVEAQRRGPALDAQPAPRPDRAPARVRGASRTAPCRPMTRRSCSAAVTAGPRAQPLRRARPVPLRGRVRLSTHPDRADDAASRRRRGARDRGALSASAQAAGRVDRGAAQPHLEVQVRARRARRSSRPRRSARPRRRTRRAGPRSATGARTSWSRRARGGGRRASRSRPDPGRALTTQPLAGGRHRIALLRGEVEARDGSRTPRGPNVSPTAAATGRRKLSGERGAGRRSAASVAAPATPSAVRPAQAWKRRSAASERGPRPPSTAPDGKPWRARRNCSAATSQPRARRASGRLPSRGRPRRPRARRVRGPRPRRPRALGAPARDGPQRASPDRRRRRHRRRRRARRAARPAAPRRPRTPARRRAPQRAVRRSRRRPPR